MSIADKLNINDEIEPVEGLKVNFEEPVFTDNESDLIDDYKYIRKKLRFSVAACEAVLESALKDMAINPGARSVEGCSAIIKTITECTNQLLGLHEKKKKIFNIAEPEKTTTVDGESDDAGVKCSVDDIIESLSKQKSKEVE